jgi:hypothetical protein
MSAQGARARCARRCHSPSYIFFIVETLTHREVVNGFTDIAKGTLRNKALTRSVIFFVDNQGQASPLIRPGDAAELER